MRRDNAQPPGHPTFDKDGYPTEDTLRKIETWPTAATADLYALVQFVRAAWKYPDYFRLRSDHWTLSLSTGGWSGNEMLVGALQNNLVFWGLCWESSRRGGHYEFVLPPTAREKTSA